MPAVDLVKATPVPPRMAEMVPAWASYEAPVSTPEVPVIVPPLKPVPAVMDVTEAPVPTATVVVPL